MDNLDQAFMDQALEELAVTRDAVERYGATESYQNNLKRQYYRRHYYYQPPLDGDQWPEDRSQRPGKIHVTVNIIKPGVNIDARLQALLPRISLKPDSLSEEQRIHAESAEKLILDWLDSSGWDVWLGTLTRVKCLYGKGVLKPFWNNEAKRPDVKVVENPGNLRIGWGSSDFNVMDWALYEYSISPQEAMIRFPDVQIELNKGSGGKVFNVIVASDHTDPLGQKIPEGNLTDISRPIPYQPSDYEQKQVRVWDYWYKKPDGKGGATICNAMFVEGHLVPQRGNNGERIGPIVEHKELPDIPYIVIPQETEPGSPEGISDVDDLVDLQIELNRAMAHWMQLIHDELDPAWQLTGENADSVPAGVVPRGGEIVPAGSGNQIQVLNRGINTFPIDQLVTSIWDHYHRITGLSEILFGQMPGAQTSGRAIAVQVEAASNRLDPKRRLLYAGLRDLLVFWTIMAERVDPAFEVTDNTGQKVQAHVKDIIGGFRRWKIIAPEITPRDLIENTQNEINKVQAHLSSLRTSMDAVGQDSPEDEIKLIQEELMNAQLNPNSVQAYVALFPMVLQMQQQYAQLQQQLNALPQGATAVPGQGGPPGGAVAQAQGALNGVQQAQYAAQPTQLNDQNQPQPMTQAGSPPPPGAPAPAGARIGSTLIRNGRVSNQSIVPGT